MTFLPMAFTASSSCSWRRPVMKTYAPSATNSFAVASAIPDVAPVMTATFPSSFPIAVLLLVSVFDSLIEAADDADSLAGDPLGVVGGEEGGDGRAMSSTLTDAAERGLRDSFRLEIGCR